MSNINSKDKLLSVLKLEYEYAKKELFYYMEKFDKNENMSSISVSILGLLLTISEAIKSDKIPIDNNIKIIGVFFLSIISTYTFAMTIGSLYYLILNSARLRYLENKINEILGKDVLNWENYLMIKIHKVDNLFLDGGRMINVNHIKAAFFMFIHILAQVVFGYLIFSYSKSWFVAYIIFQILTLIFMFSQWFFYLNWLQEFFYDIMKNKEKITKNNKLANGVGLYISLAIFISMVLPMIIFAGIDNALIGSKYDLPLIKYTSIWFGDVFILTTFNVVFFSLVYKISDYIKDNIISIMIASIVSSFINFYTHFILWTGDSVTGFMDNISGLTISGWIHFIYSTVQMFFILLFLFTLPKISKNPIYLKSIKILNLLLLFFTLLQIPYFIIRNFSKFHSKGIINLVLLDGSSMLTIVCVGMYFLIVYRSRIFNLLKKKK